MFEDVLTDLLMDISNIDYAEPLEDFEDSPDRNPDRYYWFSILCGGKDGLREDEINQSYTVNDIPDRKGVVVLCLWKHPTSQKGYFMKGSTGDEITERFAQKS